MAKDEEGYDEKPQGSSSATTSPQSIVEPEGSVLILRFAKLSWI